MPALGLALALSKHRQPAAASGPIVPTNFTATAEDRNVALTWDANANPAHLLYLNTVAVFGTASNFTNVGFPNASYDVAADDAEAYDNVPPLRTGSLFYFWIVPADGGGAPIGDPVGPITGRPFVVLANLASTTLFVPDGATMDLIDLLFRAPSALPDGLVINDGSGWETFGGEWLDSDDFSPADNHPVTGAFTITNLTGDTFTFWNAEP